MTDRPDMSGRFFLCPLHACAIAAGDAARNVSTMPRLRLAPGSLARQLGGRHDGGGGGTREGSAGALQGCAASSRFGTACCRAAWLRPVSGRRVGHPCKHGCAHLAPIVRIKCGMTAQTRRLCCHGSRCRGCHRGRRCAQCLYNVPFVSSSRLRRRGTKNGERWFVAPRRGCVRSSAVSGVSLRTCLQMFCAACP